MTMTPAVSGRNTPVRPTTPDNSVSNTPGVSPLEVQIASDGDSGIPLVIGELTLTSPIQVPFQSSEIVPAADGTGTH